MENKKTLIIINPMSSPLQKLHEVLKSISADEGIEIIVSNNLKELAQLLSMGGQFLTLSSDPKVCFTYLQENRVAIANSRSKTLLFTPKDIPIKVLDKFLKIGLSENVLDTLPPKTLLYKVKLLIKSLKKNDIKDDQKNSEDQVVKSMLDTSQSSDQEKNMVQKDLLPKADTPANVDKKKKNIELDIEPGMDYLNDAKKKRKNYQEESIETKWSAKRPLSEDDNSEESDYYKKESSGESVDELDKYYKKKKHNSIELDITDGDSQKKPKSAMEEALEKNKKDKNKFIELDIEDDGKGKDLKNSEEAEAISTYYKSKSQKKVELEFEESDANQKNATKEEEEEDLRRKELGSLRLVDDDEDAKKNNLINDDEDEEVRPAKKSTPKKNAVKKPV